MPGTTSIEEYLDLLDLVYPIIEMSNQVNICLCCSSRSIEINTFDAKNNCQDHQKSIIGLNCMVCGQFLCSDCISNLKKKLCRLKGNIHSSFIPFQDAILTYEKEKIQMNSEHYIGHCCMIKHYRKKI